MREKFGLQIATGLQSPTDCKVIQYMGCMKTIFLKKRFDITAKIK